jgi:hypothetical protein
MRLILLLLVVGWVGGGFVAAEERLPSYVEREVLVPSQVLDQLLGEWHQSYVIQKALWTEKEKRGSASFTCRKLMGGRYVEQCTVDGTGAESKHVFLADDKNGVLWGWHFPQKGDPTASKGEWNGERAELTWTVMGNGEETARTVINFGVPNIASWVLEVVGPKGELLYKMEGKDTRLGD